MPLTELWTRADTNGSCSPHKARTALGGAWKSSVGCCTVVRPPLKASIDKAAAHCLRTAGASRTVIRQHRAAQELNQRLNELQICSTVHPALPKPVRGA